MVHAKYSSMSFKRQLPRLPLEGSIDLTYRCNNNCKHCWVRVPSSPTIKALELQFDEIEQIALQARKAGCRQWAISGGEPLLRDDFEDIFRLLSTLSSGYSLNTNGTRITPGIARLLTRKGYKMVALYGADEEIYDKVTRVPGSFQACMRGFSYLREAGAGFTVQIIPMRDNFHQLEDMIALASKLSPSLRIGASWLYLSAYLDEKINRDIISQRLSPSEVVGIDPARPQLQDYIGEYVSLSSCSTPGDQKLFDSCIRKGNQFHIDPYGTMALCSTLKDPAFRHDLKKYSFETIWSDKITAPEINDDLQKEYNENCGMCTKSGTCHWCPAYGYLEKGRVSAKIPYLCEIAQERINYKNTWMKENYQRFEIAEMTVHVDSDIPFSPTTFAKRFDTFRTGKLGDDNLSISHHYGLPDLALLQDSELVYDKLPWAVYKHNSSYIYLSLGTITDHSHPNAVAVFNETHTKVRIYHRNENLIKGGNLGALTGFPSDQVMLSHVLSHRKGCYLHSAGLILNGKGILFLGHSGAGKSTIVKMLKHYGDVLSDDRNIVRRWKEGFRLHGTWSHGELPLVMNKSAPLEALVFINQESKTELTPLADNKKVFYELLNRVIKPFVTTGWWERTIDLLAELSSSVPSYCLAFTKDKEDMIEAVTSITGKLDLPKKRAAARGASVENSD